jgi:dodecin
MAIVKVIEVLAQSKESWEDAARVALSEAAMTVQGIQSIYIQEFQAIVENNEITEYRVNAKISFVVKDRMRD